jgi:hypothetical protein
MILAALDLQLIFFLVMAGFGFISWLSGKVNPGEKKPPSNSPAPRPATPQRRAAAESEEERMRRFLEALGMPADQQKPAPPPAPPQQTAPPPIPPRPKRAPKPLPAPPPLVARSLDELETTTLPVEQIALAELAVSQARAYETVTSRVSASGNLAAARREPSPLPATAPVHAVLRAALASPQQLRSAFVLREVLGPPPGLGS